MARKRTTDAHDNGHVAAQGGKRYTARDADREGDASTTQGGTKDGTRSSAQGKASAEGTGSKRVRRTAATKDAAARRTRRATAADDPANERVRRPIPVGKIMLAAVAVIAIIVCVRLFSTTLAVDVTINGTPATLRGAKTLQVAVKESGLPLNPGDLISLKGAVLQKGAGEPLSASINGEETSDLSTPLHNGDDIQLADGKDIVEPYDETIQVLTHSAETRGVGVFRQFENTGLDGVLSIRTGRESGETLSKHLFYSEDLIFTKHNPDVGERKVIALTFDDGPNATYTPEILDILKTNGAKATFFVLGNSIQDIGNEWIIQREAEEGHLVCTHTYDNAMVGGGEMNNLDAAAQVAQVEDGRAAISAALGTEANRIVRIPSAGMDAETLKNLRTHFDVEVGWNVDTGDADGTEVQAIVAELLDVTPGDVVLLHDGGGDRTATVEALREALPQLKAAGWQFVTVDALLDYPALKLG